MSEGERELFLAGVMHECGKCHHAGDCYCYDYAECCDTIYEIGDICENCGKNVTLPSHRNAYIVGREWKYMSREGDKKMEE